MTRNRSLSLRLHVGRHQVAYSLVHRTDDGRTHFDRRLSSGILPVPATDSEPQDVLDLLERALHDLRRRHGRPAAAPAAREPRGAVGGEEPYPRDPAQLRLVSDDGRTIDTPADGD